MNLAHLLTGSYANKLVHGVIYQKTVREHKGVARGGPGVPVTLSFASFF